MTYHKKPFVRTKYSLNVSAAVVYVGRDDR